MAEAPFPVSLLGGAAAAALVALAVGYPTLRLRGDYFVVASMGVGEIIVRLIEGLHKVTGGARGFPGIPHKSTLWAVWGIALVCIWLCRNLINSRHGRNCIAILENELAAQMLGVNTFAYKMKIFALSAAITGLAGGLLGHFTTVLHPSMFGFLKSTEMIITVILGGIQSLTGSILAVILVTVLPEFLRAASEWRMVIYGLAVMLMIILRPQGLLGYRELTMPKILQDLVKKTVDARKASS